jgi:transcriptional regulator with PAS, ATPase and Fis domain
MLASLKDFKISCEKSNNRLLFSFNDIPMVHFEERFPFPPMTGNHIALLFRAYSQSIVTAIDLFAEPLKSRIDMPVNAVFNQAPRQRFRVTQEPCDFGGLPVLAYRFEDITGFERQITRLKREKAEVSREKERIEEAFQKHEAVRQFVGEHSRIQAVRDNLETLAGAADSLLLVGETGTGKEILAGLFHRLSARAPHPFIKVDCSTLPQTLMESELFGYEPGAFTGAVKRHAGKFEQAQHGTLFLDEISNLSMEVQAKLLGVLEDFKITRLGGTRPVALSLGMVAASNKNLEDLISQGLFREDLYYRLNRFKLEIPPLRERMEDDIPPLCRYFIEQANREYSKQIKGISEDAYKKLYGHSFPGNVRELRNIIYKAVLFSKSESIEANDLEVQAADRQKTSDRELDNQTKKRRITKDQLIAALTENEGNIYGVAEYFVASRTTVYKRMKKYGLDPNNYRAGL